MDFVIIAAAALGSSLLTFFSGFGLGTLLTPVFMLFFPIEIAIAMTGVVHLLNNLFKFSLIGAHVNWKIVLRFGAPAILGAVGGAWLLIRLSSFHEPVFSYDLLGRSFNITPVKLTIAALMCIFGLVELLPALKKFQFSKKWLIPGGILSGFFGGLSGHQGALRTAFLVRLGLSKEVFIATGIAVSLMIDLTRIPMYYKEILRQVSHQNILYMVIATVAAFAGAVAGKTLLKKVTLEFVHIVVGITIILLSLGLGSGLI